MVLNPTTRVYYILPASELSEKFSQEQLDAFLQDILNGKAVVRLQNKLFFQFSIKIYLVSCFILRNSLSFS
jgi:hypothetical protein